VAVLLAIYLNDHLAAATGARELVRRAAGSNRGSSYGQFLDQLSREIDEDRTALIEIMRSLRIGTDPLKTFAAWGAEKLGRFKANGRVLSYSPLSRLEELELLELGVRGKRGLWLALERIEPDRPELSAAGLPGLVARAERQIEQLEEHRLRAAGEALR
jgi:hypothetical protein